MAATEKLYPLLGKDKGNAMWCNNPEIYSSGTENHWGSLDISTAWFQQAHDVSSFKT
jgi:hypothetical protein